LYTAEEYLYKNNVFVVVSFEWRQFLTSGYNEKLLRQEILSPVVTKKYAAKMKHYSLRLHVTRNMNTVDPPLNPPKEPVYSFLLVAEDMDALCFSLRFRLNPLRGFAVAIAESAAPQDQLRCIGIVPVGSSHRKMRPPSLKIEFRDTCFRVADSNLQDQLLGSIMQVACPSMQVSLLGNLRLQKYTPAGIKNRMGPSVVSFEALAWDHRDIVVEAKKFGDLAASSGEYVVAPQIYDTIIHQLAHWRTRMSSQDSNVTSNEIEVLRQDILISTAYLKLRLGDLRTLTHTINSLDRGMTRILLKGSMSDMVFQKLKAQFMHILLLGSICEPINELDPKFTEFPLEDAIEDLSKDPDEPYQQHDLQIFRAVAGKDGDISRYFTLDQSSVRKLAPFCSRFHESEEFPKKSDHIVGLQNMNAMRQLSSEDKGNICKLQQKFGAPITRWD
jgi:hypothetical protein